eukprot:TRINITY_DN32513_c0_g1_i1.p1 TRINITY_DN32513_c0_g1~~TRINITY_DN32513_c0_g1_i1.p1  ORF type:complete len:637 (-),score=71.73 TRINITY_DN32513_c0_g1_i1:27-1937(-)
MWLSRTILKKFPHLQRRSIQCAVTPGENLTHSSCAPNSSRSHALHLTDFPTSWSYTASADDALFRTPSTCSTKTNGAIAECASQSKGSIVPDLQQYRWVFFLETLVKHFASAKDAAEQSESSARERLAAAEAREMHLRSEIDELKIQVTRLKDLLAYHESCEAVRACQTASATEQDLRSRGSSACEMETRTGASFERCSAHPRFWYLYASPLSCDQMALGQLRVQEEAEAIDEALQGTMSLQVDVATVSSLRKAFGESGAWLHLSLHCLRSSQSQSLLVLEKSGGSGRAHKLDAADVSLLLHSDIGDCAPEFVFVSACESQEFGSVFLRAGARHVICCSSRVRDSSARQFASMLYHELANQKGLDCAFEVATRQAELTGDKSKYVLLSSGSPWPRLTKPSIVPRPRLGFSSNALPPPVEDFVGRRDVIELVLSALQRRHCVVLHCEAPLGLSAALIQIARCASLPGRLFSDRVTFFPQKIAGGLCVVDDADTLLAGDGNRQLRRHLEIQGSALLLGCHTAQHDPFQGAVKAINIELPALNHDDLAEVFLRSCHRPLCMADFQAADQLQDAERSLGYREAFQQLREHMDVFCGRPGLVRTAAASVFKGSQRIRGNFGSLLLQLQDASECMSRPMCVC